MPTRLSVFFAAIVILSTGLGLVSIPVRVAGAAADPSAEAAAALATARQHAGLSNKRVTGLRLRGTLARRTEAGTTVDQALDLRLALPDRYRLSETWKVPSGTMTNIRGFNGTRLLNDLRASSPDAIVASSWGPKQIDRERQEFARMALALLLAETPAVPMSFTLVPPSASSTEAATNGRIVIRASSRGGTTITMHLDRASHTLQSLEYETSENRPGGASWTARRRLVLGDHRIVQGVRLPHLIVVHVDGTIKDRIVGDAFSVNPHWSSDDFS